MSRMDEGASGAGGVPGRGWVGCGGEGCTKAGSQRGHRAESAGGLDLNVLVSEGH